PEELADLVEQAVRDGDTVVIDRGGELAYSDDVPPGGTGEADDPPTEPGAAPDSETSGGSDTSGTGSSDYESGGS
ncbi:MAG: hypothetical protein M3408_01095, partial [Actinomycetota bacterium]|nr:hypothetical protein [Actinomycetota bacterium]